METPMTLPSPGPAEARMIVTNPTLYAGRPSLRLAAWAALKASRGQYVHQFRIERMQKENQHETS